MSPKTPEEIQEIVSRYQRKILGHDSVHITDWGQLARSFMEEMGPHPVLDEKWWVSGEAIPRDDFDTPRRIATYGIEHVLMEMADVPNSNLRAFKNALEVEGVMPPGAKAYLAWAGAPNLQLMQRRADEQRPLHMNYVHTDTGQVTESGLYVNAFPGKRLFELKATHGVPLETSVDLIINDHRRVVDWCGFVDEARKNGWWDFQTLEAITNALGDADVPHALRDGIIPRVKLYMLKNPLKEEPI